MLNTGPHSCIWGGGSNYLAPALGRTHRMRYYDDTEGFSREYRPEGIPAESMETQIVEQIEEESVGGDSEVETLEPSVSHRNTR